MNDTVSGYNMALSEKYKFIKNYDCQTASEKDFKRQQLYKSQEMSETKGRCFQRIVQVVIILNCS